MAAAIGAAGGARAGGARSSSRSASRAQLPTLFGRPAAPARGVEIELAAGPVEHLDRPRPGAARVAAVARRARLRPGARLERHVPVLRRRGARREGARQHGQDLAAHARASAGAGAPAAMTSWCSTRRPPATRSGMLQLAADVRRDRARRPDRGTDPRRCRSCSRTPRAPAIVAVALAPRWRSPRRSSCRTGCDGAARARASTR